MDSSIPSTTTTTTPPPPPHSSSTTTTSSTFSIPSSPSPSKPITLVQRKDRLTMQFTGYPRISKDTMMFLLSLWSNQFPAIKKKRSQCSSVVLLSKKRGHSIFIEYDRYPKEISAARFACLKYGTQRLEGSTVFCSRMPKSMAFKSLVNAQVGMIMVLCDKNGNYLYEEEELNDNPELQSSFKERRNTFFSVSKTTIRKFYIDDEILSRIDILKEDLEIHDEKVPMRQRILRWYLGIALLNCLRSEDDHLGVGSVLISDHNDLENADILSVGFNGIQPDVNLQNLPIRESSHDLIKERVVHAEENAILFRNYMEAENLKKCALITTLIACDDCARFINMLGIKMYYSCFKDKFIHGEVHPNQKGEQIVVPSSDRIQKFVVRHPVQLKKLRWCQVCWDQPGDKQNGSLLL